MKKEGKLGKSHMKKGVYILPNLFTSANLIFGFYSILYSIRGAFVEASFFVLISIVLDSLDGRIARMTNSVSKFGIEYDSLSDLVAFGVAPAVLIYLWSLSSFGKWGSVTACLFVLCGALRLARFNIQIGIVESKVFKGLAIPAAAAVIVTGILLYEDKVGKGPYPHILVLAAVVILSLLMVSNVKYYSFKNLNYFARKPFMSFLVIVLALLIVVAEPQVMLFTVMTGYALSGPAWFLLRLVKRHRRPATEAQGT
ncbi:MAG: CDP-alcohol phosphatidyltransferase [Syntrophus sp. PtaU1.Bin005]|jgi:CDP-diacylglycerol--serine O-phosphatidyltransferase|uniref:CDP-diacylglycerol--serine O-phosphatidyltransferase n=1 Tax=Syntrophus buswellii TaxID=43774 RepID=UPI0009CCFE24|nr:MAG: CDP-alcohol phosphatidyltransferase [Syntrophus sp. PtaB.Bin138]OPY81832.1 MAG: CDP-alcohol phosphatidyltransferase [Syntrophus sp. PtaU1.Bin005]